MEGPNRFQNHLIPGLANVVEPGNKLALTPFRAGGRPRLLTVIYPLFQPISLHIELQEFDLFNVVFTWT